MLGNSIQALVLKVDTALKWLHSRGIFQDVIVDVFSSIPS